MVGEKQVLCKYTLERCEPRTISNGLGGKDHNAEVKDSFLSDSEKGNVLGLL